MGHILIENSSIFDTDKEHGLPTEDHYDSSKGYWRSANGSPSILNGNFNDDSSKKCDIETGEDKKGE